MEQNKTGKYFKYAIGEILLVVIGILIALSLNNWNENRQLSNVRISLVNDLINDFEVTANNLDILKLEIDKRSNYMNNFTISIYHNKDYKNLDSLRNKIIDFFNYDEYGVTLTSYTNAESSGKINLLKDKEVSYLFSKFFEDHEEMKRLDDILVNMFYSGPIWELTKSLGSMWVLINNKDYTEKDYIDILNKTTVRSTLETINLLGYNRQNIIGQITIDIEKILARLYCLKDANCDTQKTND